MENTKNIETFKKPDVNEALKSLEKKESFSIQEERLTDLFSSTELPKESTEKLATSLNLDFANLLIDKGFDFKKAFESKVKAPIGSFEGIFIS